MSPDPVTQPHASVHDPGQRHRTGLLTLVFTDIVGSAQIKQQLGDRAGVALIQQHHAALRKLLTEYPDAEVIDTAGDSFFILFVRPSEAVLFALRLQAGLRALAETAPKPVMDRIGIHIGEVIVQESEGADKQLQGSQVDTCARIMSLAGANQILLSRAAFDNARQALKGSELEGLGELEWLNHGPYLLKGWDEPVEICEVGERGLARLKPPEDVEKARRVSPDSEPVLGWRPAIGQVVPGSKWVLERKLGQGGFGEVWLGRNRTTRQARVFKFCFQAERVRFLKRELTLFRLLKERVGDHPNIVGIHDVNLDTPPFYVEMDHIEGQDLRSWCERGGATDAIPLQTRLEIVAQAADGLQAAHDAGIIHRDIKPANILIGGRGTAPTEVRVKLTDFGIGQVVSADFLKGVTQAGFTQTMVGDSSSGSGTHLYMAPELLAGQAASAQSDIYSLGVVLYQLILGDLKRPVTTDWAGNLSDPLLREDLALCFAGRPQQRFASAKELAANLRGLSQRRAARALQERTLALRERAAYRRGVARTAAIATLLIAGVAALGLYALEEERRARLAAARAERQVYSSDMILAFQSLESGNLGYARQLAAKHLPKPSQHDLRGWEWRYLWQQCQGDQLFTLGRHDKGVTVALFLAENVVASGSKDATVKLWDVESRRLIHALPHVAGVHALAVWPDGKTLVSGCDDGLVTGWDLATSPPRRDWTLTNAPDVNALVFSQDGSLLACAGSGRVVLWDAVTRAELFSCSGAFGYRGFKTGLAISPDGQRLAVSTLTSLDVWDWANRTHCTLLEPATLSVAMSFSPDNQFLISGGGDNDLLSRIWDIQTGQQVQQLTNFLHWVGWIDFAPEQPVMATASGDHLVKLWNTADWTDLATLRGHEFEVWSVQFSPSGRRLVTASKDDTVKIWDANARPARNRPIPTPADVAHKSISADGLTLMWVRTNGTVSLDDIVHGKELDRFAGPKAHTLSSVAVSSKGRFVAFAHADGTVTLRDQSEHRFFTLPGDDSRLASRILGRRRVWQVDFLRDHRTLAVSRPGEVELWDVLATNRIQTLSIRDQANATIEFSGDGRKAAVGFYDASVDIWDLEARTKTTLQTGHEERIMNLAFSLDGRWLATSSVDFHLVKLWDLSSGQQPAQLGGQLALFTRLTFSPDGRLLAAGGADGTVTLWDIAGQPQQVGKLRNHRATIEFLAFSPDGHSLISESADGLLVWRAPRLPSL